MYQSNEINELMSALAKAQGKMTGALKDCANPFYKSKYADINSVWTACRVPLSENGLAVTQTVHEKENGEVYLKTTLGHSSGQWMASIMPIRIKSTGKNELQELGGCLSYLRRYALSALVGVTAAEEDDDGNSAVNYKANPQKVEAAPQMQIVTDTQLREFSSMLAQCEDGYRDRINEYLVKNNIRAHEMMPAKMFESLRLNMRQHIDALHPEVEACA
jgi:hypothetical protein